MLPSFCWKFSTMALIALAVAIPVLLSVWTYSFFPSFFLYFMFSLTAWYDVQFEQLVNSLYAFSLGNQPSISYFLEAITPMSPVQTLTTLWGIFNALNIFS